MYLFPDFKRKTAAAPLTVHLSLESELSNFSVKERVLTTKCQVSNHLLETYPTDDIIENIAGADSKIAHYVKLSTMAPLEFCNELWLKTRRCPHVYDNYVSSM